MATRTVGPRRSFKAGADLSAKQYFIVKQSADNTVVLASAATDFIVGTLNNTPSANDAADVTMRHGGETGLVKLGGSVSIGDKLTSDANGKAIATTTTGNEILGRALQNGVDGDIIEYEPCTDRV